MSTTASTHDDPPPEHPLGGAGGDLSPPASSAHRRRWWWTSLAVLAVTASLAGYAVWADVAPPTIEPTEQPPPKATVPVTSGRMLAETTVPGTLRYVGSVPVTSGLEGTVTQLPPVGATITPGGVLYRVNTRPVVLLAGAMPAWRDFASGMSRGEDIQQLEDNLLALGFFEAEPDDRFTWDTMVAIKRWQESLGLRRTGTIERTAVLFSDHDLRVDTVQTRVGAQVAVGAAMYQSTSPQQVVTLDVPSSNRQIAVVGAAVTVALPTGTTVEGTVAGVGAPVDPPDAEGTETGVVVPVTVSLADQGAVSDLTLARVAVRFASIVREDVLTVPVDALVPLDDTAFAVELPEVGPDGGRILVPVQVGAFSAGDVEISGDGVVEGMDVVVTTR